MTIERLVLCQERIATSAHCHRPDCGYARDRTEVVTQRPPLALMLLHGSRWFDDRLLDRLAEQGWPRLTRAQSLLFPHLDPERGVSYTDLARRLSATPQSTHESVHALKELGLVASGPDPAEPGRNNLVMTYRGFEMINAAGRIFSELEAEMFTAEERSTLTRLLERLMPRPERTQEP